MNQQPVNPVKNKIPAPWEGVGLVLVQLLTLLSMSVVVGVATMELGLGNSAAIYLLFFGELFFALPLLMWMWVRGFNWRSTFNLHPTSWTMMGWGALLGLLAWPIASAITIPFEWLLSLLGPSPELPTPTTAVETVVFGMAVMVIAPLVEEPMFRGFVLRGWLRFGSMWAIGITGVLFGILHGQLSPLPGLIGVGIVLGVVSYRSGSIFPAMVMHGTFNAVSFVFLLAQQQLAWLTDWYFWLGGLVLIPLFGGAIVCFYRTTTPGPVDDSPWPDTTGTILIMVMAVLVMGMFTVFALLDIFTRIMPVNFAGG